MLPLTNIYGKQLSNIGRAGNMVWVLIGNEVEIYVRDVQQKRREFSLNLQCPWRIENLVYKKVVLASNDIYVPNDYYNCRDNFEWDIQGHNLFDLKSKKMLESYPNLVVSNIDLSEQNDITINFSDKLILKTFVNSSSNIENWRLIDNITRRHYVCGGEVIEEI